MPVRTVVAVLILATLALSGCASTPENRLRNEWWDIFWWTARKCQGSTTNFNVDDVAANGRLHVELHHIASGIEEFRQCYWKGLAAEIERRHAKGLPVPEWVNDHPEIEVEVADD
jgi:hypothetical protein